MQMEKKWRGAVVKQKSEYSSAEVIVPTEINTSLPRPSATTADPSTLTEEEGDVKVEEYLGDGIDGDDQAGDGGAVHEGVGDEAGEENEQGGEEEDGREEEEDGISLDLQGLRSNAPPLDSKSSLPLPLPPKSIWEGVIDMTTISDMPSPGYIKKKCHSRALYVSGPDMEGIPVETQMTVKGKIEIPKLYGYLTQVEGSSSRSVIVAALEAISDDNDAVYKTAFNYFVEQVCNHLPVLLIYVASELI